MAIRLDRRIVGVVVSVFVLLMSFAGSAAAQIVLPDGFTHTRLVYPLNVPTAMVALPDGRLFICEHGGTLRVV
jgi:hypothetical protein